jgi:predicted HicB family RNase H-like nuclease
VVNLYDVITFEGESVAELRQAFEDSVEDYLDFCRQRGEKPEKPYSGTLSLRINPGLHRAITLQAKMEKLSINQWISNKLEEAIVNE